MSENEIVERVDRIREICGEVANGLSVARRQGRMPSMDEARQMDQLSQELLQGIGTMPRNACSQIQNPERQRQVWETLELARQALKDAVQADVPSCKSSVPRAASSRLEFYCTG